MCFAPDKSSQKCVSYSDEMHPSCHPELCEESVNINVYAFRFFAFGSTTRLHFVDKKVMMHAFHINKKVPKPAYRKQWFRNFIYSIFYYFFNSTMRVASWLALRSSVCFTTFSAKAKKARPVMVSSSRAAGVPLSPFSQMLCTIGI